MSESQDNTSAEELRKKLKRDFRQKALVVYHTGGERTAYGWTPEAFIELVDAYTKDRERQARLDGQRKLIEAIIDLFINPPVGAAEDMHYHPHQIRDMLSSITDEQFAELTSKEEK